MADPRIIQAKKIARRLREEFRERGEFTQTEYVDALARKLRTFLDVAFDGFVIHIAEHIDKESREGRSVAPMFPGFDMEGEYKSGDNKRIAKKRAQLRHADIAMALVDRNLSAVSDAATKQRDELTLLRPYWGDGRTKEEAVRAYLEDNPDSNRRPG